MGAADGLRILIVSRLEREKGIADALQAFARFLNSGGKGTLSVVGTGSLRNELESLARDLAIVESVVFHGWQGDLSPYYQEADLYLFPSHYEGWGMAAFDAARAGIPVIMTDVGLAGEVVRDGINGIVVPVGNIEHMAKALSALHRDPNRLRSLSDRPLDYPVRTWEEYLQRYRLVVESCAAAR